MFYVNSANHHLLWDSQVNGIVTQMDLGGVVTATPAATTTSAGGIVVVVRGTGGVIYEMINEGNGFGPWIRVQNGLIGAGASLVNDPTTDNFYLFATGTNSQLYMAYSLDGGFTWSSWLNLGGVLHSAPSAAYATTHIVATVRGTDRGIWTDTGSAPYTATSDWHWSTTSIGGPP